jgi:ATP-dependent helicase/nuclease subunit A
MEFALSVAITNPETTPVVMPQAVQPKEEGIEEVLLALSKDIETQLSYIYPHAGLGMTPIKMSISELKRRRMPEEEYTPGILRVNRVVLTESVELGAAETGTINHYVIQHIDETCTEDCKQIEEQLEEMVQSGLISEKQRAVVSAQKIYAFFTHPLGKRLKQAKEIFREFDFYMQMPASEITAGLETEDGQEPVLLQGIADCFFYEEDGAVLIDYKTDRVTASDANQRAEEYRIQMECYERGLNEILPIPIKEKYVYFLNCGKAVAL